MTSKHILNESNSQTPCIVVEGQFMKVNGKEIPYTQQMIKTNNFYLTDLCIDLPIEEGIKHFDDRYFQFMLNKEILKQLERLQPAMGLTFLQEMPNLTQRNYIAIFWRLSLAKTKQILMQNEFYMYLWQRFTHFLNKKSIQIADFDLTLLCNLDAPHKRLLHLLDYLPSSQPLRQAFYIIATEIIMPVLGCQDFIFKLAKGQTEMNTQSNQNNSVQNNRSNENIQQLDRHFLRNILGVARTLITLSKIPQQIIQLCNVKNQRQIMHILLNKNCLSIIASHFQYLFDYDRNNLTKILSLIALQRGNELWEQVISRKKEEQKMLIEQNQQQPQTNPNQQENTSEAIDFNGTAKFDQIQKILKNEDKFYMLVINNFYEIGQPHWDITQIILQSLIKHSFDQSNNFLHKLLIDLLSKDSSSSIQITIKFLTKTYSFPKFDTHQLKFFLIQLMTIIYSSIKYLYDQLKRDQNKNIKQPKKKTSNIQGTITHPKQLLQCISYIKICTILVKYKYIELLQDNFFFKIINKLLIMTKNSRGLIQGVRRTFLIERDVYIYQKQLDIQKYAFIQKRRNIDIQDQKQIKTTKFSEKTEEIIEFLKQLI